MQLFLHINTFSNFSQLGIHSYISHIHQLITSFRQQCISPVISSQKNKSFYITPYSKTRPSTSVKHSKDIICICLSFPSTRRPSKTVGRGGLMEKKLGKLTNIAVQFSTTRLPCMHIHSQIIFIKFVNVTGTIRHLISVLSCCRELLMHCVVFVGFFLVFFLQSVCILFCQQILEWVHLLPTYKYEKKKNFCDITIVLNSEKNLVVIVFIY